MTATTQTVREIALENPASIRVFEQFGIDYCCGGRKPLAEACAAGHIAMDDVLAELQSVASSSAPAADDWSAQPLAVLSAHIVSTHHAYVKRELPRLADLADRVVNRHGDTRSELSLIRERLAAVTDELTPHLAKEEFVLFPHIANLESAVAAQQPRPRGCFGTVANPIAMMTQEHDAAGAIMAELRKLSHDFTPPAGACPTFHGFYNGLREFEQDLHQHIHLENNILFPRAIELEASTEQAPVA